MYQNQQVTADDASEKSRSRLFLGLSVGAIVVALLFGYWRLQPESPTVLPPNPKSSAADGYSMRCNACKTSFEIKRAEFDTWPRVDLAYKCPKCGSPNTAPDKTKVGRVKENGGG